MQTGKVRYECDACPQSVGLDLTVAWQGFCVAAPSTESLQRLSAGPTPVLVSDVTSTQNRIGVHIDLLYCFPQLGCCGRILQGDTNTGEA